MGIAGLTNDITINWLFEHDLPVPEKEHRFHKTRRWRFDYAWVHEKIALEVEGLKGINNHVGRHRSIKGYKNDCEKYSHAAIEGWCVIRRTTDQLHSQETIDMIKRAFQLKAHQAL